MSKKLTTEEFVSKTTLVHDNKYNYSKFIYKGYHTNGIIICKEHGDFLQMPSNHLNGQGCPKCKFEKIANLKRSSVKEFISKATKIHNNKYNYSEFVYENAFIKGEIICPVHGNFFQSPNNHLNGRGCRKCQYEMLSNITISKGQEEFINYLKLSNTNFSIDKFIVDGFDPQTNTIYEFLGDYWHGNPLKFYPNLINPTDKLKRTFGTLYKLTFDRFNKLRNLGFIIKYTWESDWNNFKKGYCSYPNITIYE